MSENCYITKQELDRTVNNLEKNLLTKKEFYEYMDNLHRDKLSNGKRARSNPTSSDFFDQDVKQTLIKLLVGALIALSGVGAGVATALRIFE